jgi:hypothetical protein
LRLKTPKQCETEVHNTIKKVLLVNGFQEMALKGFRHMIEHYPTHEKVGEPIILIELNLLRPSCGLNSIHFRRGTVSRISTVNRLGGHARIGGDASIGGAIFQNKNNFVLNLK